MEPKNEEKLLKTENGRFLMEIDRLNPDFEVLLGASLTDECIKQECREIIAHLKKNIQRNIEMEERSSSYTSVPYDLYRGAENHLYGLLYGKGDENESLYLAFGHTIGDAMYSAMGWPKNK